MGILKLGTKGEQLNLLIRQGADFGPHDAIMTNPGGTVPVNLTGCTIRGGMKKEPNSPSRAADFVCEIVDPVAGHYRFGLPHAVTATLKCGPSETDKASQYVHDIELVDASGRVTPLYFGDAAVFRNV